MNVINQHDSYQQEDRARSIVQPQENKTKLSSSSAEITATQSRNYRHLDSFTPKQIPELLP